MATFPHFSGTLGATQRSRNFTDFDAQIEALNDPRNISNAIRLKQAKENFSSAISGSSVSTGNPLAGITSVYQPGNLFGSPTVGTGGSYMNKFGTFQDIPGSGNQLTAGAAANAASGKVAVDTTGLNRSQVDALKLKFGDKFLEVGPKEALAIYTGGMGGSDRSQNPIFFKRPPEGPADKVTTYFGDTNIFGRKKNNKISTSAGSGVRKP